MSLLTHLFEFEFEFKSKKEEYETKSHPILFGFKSKKMPGLSLATYFYLKLYIKHPEDLCRPLGLVSCYYASVANA